MKTYEIVNKIFIQKKKKDKVSFLVGSLNVCLIFLVLLSVFQLLMKESLGEVIRDLILPFALVSYAKSRCTSSDYLSVALELTIMPEEIQMVYPSIDRNDGGGLRRELIQINKTGLDKIMYSDELKSIRILAKAIINVEYEKNHKNSIIDERVHNNPSEYIIYLPTDKVNDILNEIEYNFKINIENLQ